MKIIYLDCHIKSVSGGHKYNDEFLEYLQNLNGEKIIKTPSCAATYSSWRKLIAPFAELKRIKLFKKGSLVFWSDTAYKYHFLLAIIAKLFKNIHSTIIIHHFLFLGEKGVRRIIKQFFQTLYISLFDDIIVPSPYTFDIAKKLFSRKIIHYVPLPFKREFNISNKYEKGNLLYVGTIEERKGLMYLICALEIILKKKPDFDFHLNVVGKVTEQAYNCDIKNKIQELGINNKVFFLGRVSDEQLKDCYEKAELFVFPSLLEGYGIVLVEAMSKGLPIIAFNNSAMPYSIKDGINGLLASNKDVQSYSDKILEILGNENFRKSLQEGMKRTIEGLKTQEDFESSIRNYYNYTQQPR